MLSKLNFIPTFCQTTLPLPAFIRRQISNKKLNQILSKYEVAVQVNFRKEIARWPTMAQGSFRLASFLFEFCCSGFAQMHVSCNELQKYEVIVQGQLRSIVDFGIGL